ncbi:MAG: WD40 repeat domain-containing protein [Gemmataceae bacterium]
MSRLYVLALLLAPGLALAQVPTDRHGDPLPANALARLGSARLRHSAAIVFAAFVPDGKRVVSLSSDGVLCVWEFPSGKTLRRFETLSGSGAATGATMSPDGAYVTAFCDDGFLRIWDLAKGKETGKVAHGTKATAISSSPFTSSALAARRLGPTLAPVYSPDGKTLLLAAAGARALQFIDLPSGKDVGPSIHGDALSAIWFSADGTRIFTKDAHQTYVWNAATGEHSATAVKTPPTPGTPTIISPDGRFGVSVARFASPAAARAAKTRDAVLFDAVTGKALVTIDLETEITPTHRRPLAFSPDGALLAVVEGDATQKIQLYQVPSGKPLRTLDAGPLPARAGKAGFKGFGTAATSGQKLFFAPDGKALAFRAGPGAPLLVFDTASAKQIASLPAADGVASQGTFSPDGRCLALEQHNGTVTLYELATGQPRRSYGVKLAPIVPDRSDPLADLLGDVVADSRVCVALARDGKSLALAGPGGAVQVIDVLSGKERAAFKGHTGTVNALAFAPDGKRLASASQDSTALIWDLTKIAPLPSAKAARAEDLDAWWQTLAGAEGEKAAAGMAGLVAAPKEAVTWIKDHVKPVAPLDVKQINEWIAQLGDEQFRIRAKANEELLKVGEPLLPLIEKALADKATPEAARRLTELRAKIAAAPMQGERLRAYRAIEVLEQIATPEARRALQALADGAPGALVTDSAAAALKR